MMQRFRIITTICVIMTLFTIQVLAEDEFVTFCQHESHSITQSEALSIATQQMQSSSYICELYHGMTIAQPLFCDLNPSTIETRMNRITTEDNCTWVVVFRHRSSIHHTCGLCYLIDADSGKVILSDSGYMSQLRSIWGEHFGTERSSEWPYEARCLFSQLFSCHSDKLVMPDETDMPMEKAIQIARPLFIAEGADSDELDTDFHLYTQLIDGYRAGYHSRVWYISYVYNEQPADKGTGWGIFIDSNTGEAFGLTDPDTMG